MKKLLTFIILTVFVSVALYSQIAVQPSNLGAPGAGSEENPYLISSLSNLYWISVNPDQWAKYYMQTADIDAAETSAWFEGAGWKPIGRPEPEFYDRPIPTDFFRGQYDGNKHKITNLHINRPGEQFIGLFGGMVGGYIGEPEYAVLRNIILENVNITGLIRVGSLLGKINDNQYVVIERCSVNGGNVRGTGTTGGLIGANNGYPAGPSQDAKSLVIECHANVTVRYTGTTVDGTDTKIGGMVGCNQRGSTYFSYSLGKVYGNNQVGIDTYTAYRVGGFAGCMLQGHIEHCFSIGEVIATGDYVDAFVGRREGAEGDGTIVDCYVNTQLAVLPANTGAFAKTTADMTYPYDENTYEEWNFLRNWAADVRSNRNNGYPYLSDDSVVKTIGTGNQEVAFENTFITLSSDNVITAGDVTVKYFIGEPDTPTFDEIIVNNISTYFWRIFATPEFNFGDGWMHIDIETLPGVNTTLLTDGEQDDLAYGILVFKRGAVNDDYQPLPTFWNSVRAGKLSVEVGSTFSEFILASNDISQTLPVELSSFTANVTANGIVELKWVAETETNMLGYNVYRGANDKLNDAVAINAIIIPAKNTSVSQEYGFEDSNVTDGETYYYWLQSMDLDLTNSYFGPITVTIEVDEESDLPIAYQTMLKKNYPNPFNPETIIELSIKEDTEATVYIYNLIGQVVKTLHSGSIQAGKHSLIWDGKDDNGRDVGSGVYFYRLKTDHYDQVNKMLLIK